MQRGARCEHWQLLRVVPRWSCCSAMVPADESGDNVAANRMASGMSSNMRPHVDGGVTGRVNA
jgi:hypothetical protein